MNCFKTQIRKAKETEWVLKLRTTYPYGLHDKIGDNYKTFNKELIYTKFPTLKISPSRIRGLKHCTINRTSRKQFLFQLNNKLIHYLFHKRIVFLVSLSMIMIFLFSVLHDAYNMFKLTESVVKGMT